MKEGYIFSVQKLAQKKDEDIQRKKKQDSSLTTLQPGGKILIPNLPEERRGRQDALLLGLGVHKVFSTHMRTLQPRRSNEKTNQKLNLSIAQESSAFFRQFVL